MLDRHGEVLHELRVELSARRLAWVKLEDVSPALLKALIKAEDRRFFDHGGVDWRALAGAAVDSAFGRGRRGGSTLTMQLAPHLDPALKPTGKYRNLAQKIDQISLARELERHWSPSLKWEQYSAVCDRMTELRTQLRRLRGVKNPRMFCRHCGEVHEMIPGPVTIRSVLFALRKRGVLTDKELNRMDIDWRRYRSTHRLDGCGRKRAEPGPSPSGVRQEAPG